MKLGPMGKFVSDGSHCQLARVSAFHALPDQTRQLLRRICMVHHLSTGETIAHQGDPVQAVHYVKSGLLRMQKQLLDGRTHIVGLLAPDHVAGTVFQSRHSFAIEAATAAEVISFEAGQFRNIVSSTPQLEQLLLRSFLDEIDAARNWLMILASHTVRARLAGFILTLISRYRDIPKMIDARGDTLLLRIPLSRVDLSNLLGVRPESLSRAFHALADEGLIKIIAHDYVAITDVDGLLVEAGDPDLFVSETDDQVDRMSKKR